MTAIARTFHEEQFRTAAEAALGAISDEQPQAVDVVERGNRKQTARVSYAARGPVVLQLCEERTWLRTEATLLAGIREWTSVPVPPVLAAGETDAVAYMVTAYVPGADLHERFTAFDERGQQRLVRAFGAHLGALHEQFRFDGYGSLVVDDGELTAWREDWPTWLGEYGTSAVEKLPEAFDDLRPALQAVLTDPNVEAAPSARLFPWDFRPGNALVADGQVTAILDWEAPLAAAPALSVAKAEYLVADWYVADPEPLRVAFREGYEQVRPIPDMLPAHRVAAIADSAVDSAGAVTNPRYPELDHDEAVAFHREALTDRL